MPLIRKPRPGASTEPTPKRRMDGRELENALRSHDEDTRWSAVRAVSGVPELLSRLAHALTFETSPRVREALFSSLTAAANAQAVELILPFIRSDDAQLRTGALDALHVMSSIVQPYVAVLLNDDDADVRLLACELARDMPTDVATDLLSALLDRESLPNVCASIVEVLAENGNERALPALQRCKVRFHGSAFLEFSIRVTIDRIQAQAGE